jgi:hypothetical protein
VVTVVGRVVAQIEFPGLISSEKLRFYFVAAATVAPPRRQRLQREAR